MAEKDIADAFAAAENRLLPPVQTHCRNGVTGVGATETGGIGVTVDTALPGTETTVVQGKKRLE